MASTPVWLITGSSGGLGYKLTLHVLAAGHRVVATVRSRTKSAEAVKEIEARGGKIIELDIAKADTIAAAAKEAESLYGHIDVLVNNAAYSLLGAVEDLS
jgi:NAD(P)-dependent dehydrogenase (short-subunit alcohol dehydrogenase family)